MARTKLPQVFPYRGSKGRLTSAISALVPSSTKTLVSLFLGSGVFEYNYAHDHPDVHVICFEIDTRIVNFHLHVLNNASDLFAAITTLNASMQPMTKEKYTNTFKGMGDSSLQDAAAFYVIAVNSFGGKVGSYGHKATFPVPNFLLLDQLPRNLHIHHGDAFDVLQDIGRFGDDVCLYMDPPYLLNNDHYRSIRNNTFDHEKLAALIHSLPSEVDWILSYNDVAKVRSLYDLDNKLENVDYFNPPCTYTVNNANKKGNELLIRKLSS